MAKPLVTSKKTATTSTAKPPAPPSKPPLPQPPTSITKREPPKPPEPQRITPADVGRMPAPPVPVRPLPPTPPAPAQTTTALSTAVNVAEDALEFQDQYDRSSLAIPFLQILQSNSPQLDPNESKYVEGAKVGQMINTLTGELFDQVEVIPVYLHSTFIEWRIREEGGGYVQDHGLVQGQQLLATCTRDEKGRDRLPNGHQLVRTETYCAVLVTFPQGENGPAEYQQCMISMTSTQLKKARNWNSRMLSCKVNVAGRGTVTAPMFFNSYVFSTVGESNAKGKWYGWQIEDGRPTLTIEENAYVVARDFRKTSPAFLQTALVPALPPGPAEEEGEVIEGGKAPF